MNPTEKKPVDEILDCLERETCLAVVACNGCPLGMETGRKEDIEELVSALSRAGKKIIDAIYVDMACNKALDGIKIGRAAETVDRAEAILVSSCGVGVQAVGSMVGKRVVPVLNTIHVGGKQGLFPSDERCGQCGDCMLGLTGGLCPITTCSKSLVNGTCGGTGDDDSCEVNSDKPCGWLAIYERLNELGRLDLYRKMAEPRDHAKQDMPFKRRSTTLWALEIEEETAATAAENKEAQG